MYERHWGSKLLETIAFFSCIVAIASAFFSCILAIASVYYFLGH